MAKCPWVVRPRHDVPTFKGRRDIAFLGGFRHNPNLEAVRFFVSEVMPSLRECLKDFKFRVYGSAIPTELYELEAGDVVIEGYVETVDEVFNQCRVFVAPLLSGAGIKGKVLEALACGVPSVLSPLAAEGTGIRDGYEAFIAAKPNEWVSKIKRLYTEPKLWGRMSVASLDLVGEQHSFDRGRTMLADGLMNSSIVCLSGMYSRSQPS